MLCLDSYRHVPTGIDELIKGVAAGLSRLCTNLCLPVRAGFIATNQPGKRTGTLARSGGNFWFRFIGSG